MNSKPEATIYSLGTIKTQSSTALNKINDASEISGLQSYFFELRLSNKVFQFGTYQQKCLFS